MDMIHMEMQSIYIRQNNFGKRPNTQFQDLL